MAEAGNAEAEFEPLLVFLARTARALPEDERYAKAIRDAAKHHGLSVERVTSEFQGMKDFILKRYRDVTSDFGFNWNGQISDCVPPDKHPAAIAGRVAGFAIDDTLAAPGTAQGAVESPGVPAPGIFPPGATPSTVGPPTSTSPHPPQCRAGTLPLDRITLEIMIPYGTLDQFKRSYFRRSKVGPPSKGTLPRG